MKAVTVLAHALPARMLWLRVMVLSTTCVLYTTSRNLRAVSFSSSSPCQALLVLHLQLAGPPSRAQVTVSPSSAGTMVLSTRSSTFFAVASDLVPYGPAHVGVEESKAFPQWAMPLFSSISFLACAVPVLSKKRLAHVLVVQHKRGAHIGCNLQHSYSEVRRPPPCA